MSLLIILFLTQRNLLPPKLDLPTNRTVTDTFKLPMNFDARVKWINVCPFIGEVKNQGRCKSGWVSTQYVYLIIHTLVI